MPPPHDQTTDDRKRRLTSDSLQQHESQFQADKSHVLKQYIVSQQAYRKFYVSDGVENEGLWKQKSPQGTPSKQSKPVLDAGFSTPVLKPRRPQSRSPSDTGKVTAHHTRRPSSVASARSESSLSRKHEEPNKKPVVREMGRPPSPGTRKARRTQKTLEECLPARSTAQPARKETAKRVRSQDRDSEREALLLGRRDRRRAKQAIVKPKAPLEEDGRTRDKKSGKESTSKKKGRPVGLAASLALMHGFSAKNVGSNRLTHRPSFGVFQKGKASAKTNTQTKRKSGAACWSEEGFLNRKDEDGDPGDAVSQSGDSVTYSPAKSPELPTSPPRKKKCTEKDMAKKPPTEAKAVPTEASSRPLEDRVSPASEQSPAIRARAESMVWDIEMDGRSLVSSAKSHASAAPPGGTVILDIRGKTWNSPEASERIESESKDEQAEKAEMAPVPADSVQREHEEEVAIPDYVNEDSRSFCSLAPSQSASQPPRDSSDTSPGGHSLLLLQRSKYFPPSSSLSPARPSISMHVEQNEVSPPVVHAPESPLEDYAYPPEQLHYDYDDMPCDNYDQPTCSSHAIFVAGHSDSALGADIWYHYPGNPQESVTGSYGGTYDPNLANATTYHQVQNYYDDSHYGEEQILPIALMASLPNDLDTGSPCDFDQHMPTNPLHAWDDGEFANSYADDAGHALPGDGVGDYVSMEYEPAQPMTWGQPAESPDWDVTLCYMDEPAMEQSPVSPTLAPTADIGILSRPLTPLQCSQDRTLLDDHPNTWRSAHPTLSQTKFPTISTVEEDVAKQLKGHWRPQRL